MTTKTIEHDDTEYTITLDGRAVAIDRHSTGMSERIAWGVWDGSAVVDSDADLGNDLWAEIDCACIDMETP